MDPQVTDKVTKPSQMPQFSTYQLKCDAVLKG